MKDIVISGVCAVGTDSQFILRDIPAEIGANVVGWCDLCDSVEKVDLTAFTEFFVYSDGTETKADVLCLCSNCIGAAVKTGRLPEVLYT